MAFSERRARERLTWRGRHERRRSDGREEEEGKEEEEELEEK